jgi:hypothetical protein
MPPGSARNLAVYGGSRDPKRRSRYRYEVDVDSPYRRLRPDERIEKITASTEATVSEIKAQIDGEYQRHVDMSAERAFQQRYSELMDLHGIVDDYVPATRLMLWMRCGRPRTSSPRTIRTRCWCRSP